MKDEEKKYIRGIGKVKQNLRRRNDKRAVAFFENDVFNVSEDYYKLIKQQERYFAKPQSRLEKLISNISIYTNFSKTILKDQIKQFEEALDNGFEYVKSDIISVKNSNVNEEIEIIRDKCRQIISQMYNIIDEYNEKDTIKTLLFNKCIEMSSNLEPYISNNLSHNFSYLKREIDEYYDSRIKTQKFVKGAGVGLALAGTVAAATIEIVDYKADQLFNALITIYGTEERIPKYVYDEIFKDSGAPKSGATEKVKEMMLSKSLKNILNDRLAEITDDVFVEELKLDYGKKEIAYSGAKKDELDGYTIYCRINNGEEVTISRNNIYKRYKDLGEDTHKDDQAKQTRKWFEKLSLEDCNDIMIFRDKEKELEEKLEADILKIENSVLKKEILDGKSADEDLER